MIIYVVVAYLFMGVLTAAVQLTATRHVPFPISTALWKVAAAHVILILFLMAVWPFYVGFWTLRKLVT